MSKKRDKRTLETTRIIDWWAQSSQREVPMSCCANCFAHGWLRAYVEKNSDVAGTCDFCEADDVHLLSTRALAGPFHNLRSMYVCADTFEGGEPLLNLVQWHWQIFDDDLSESQQQALLEAIVNSNWDDDDGEPRLDSTELYMPRSSQWFHHTHVNTWEQFCADLRRDPQTSIPFDDFIAEELSESEEDLPAGATFFRARLGFQLDESEERFAWNGAEIGAPPADKVGDGRANTKGQVVLYVGDDETTAVSEVRPARGFYVSVAQLALKRACRVLDLTKELPELNPFVRESIGWHIEIRELLNRLGVEMSRPLERTEDKTFYVPCQRFADFIHQNDYDGIRYPSALNPGGSSIFFFNPSIASVEDAKLVRVTKVVFEYEYDDEPRPADQLNLLLKRDVQPSGPLASAAPSVIPAEST